MVKRLTTSLILAFFGIIALFFLLPWQTLAQECGEPSEHYLIDNFEIVTNVDPGLIWSRDGNDWDLNCDHFNCNNLDSSGLRATIKAPYFGTLHTGDTLYLLIQRHTFNNGTHLRGRLELSNGEIITGTWTALNTDWITVGVSSENDGDQLSAIYLDATTFGSAFDESFTFLVDQSYFLASCNVQPGVYLSCPLVQNADFAAADGWLLDNGATITDSILSLGLQQKASQELVLLPDLTYQAVISVSHDVGPLGPASLRFSLGNGDRIISVDMAGWYTVTLNSPSTSPAIYSIENVSGGGSGSPFVDIDFTCLSTNAETSDCPLVPNGNFDTDENWTLSQAQINTGTLTLNPYGTASQNINLQSSTSYGGVISVTSVSASATLNVIIGAQIIPLEITSPNAYSFAFETPSLPPGPIYFSVQNFNQATVVMDSLCVYVGSETQTCIAPINGTFDTADNWTYQRGASWYSPAKAASLPYIDTAMIASTEVYSLPSLATGENLLLSFTGQKAGSNDGGVMGRVRSGASSHAFTYEMYPTEYTFEANISTLAGLDNAEVAFVNPGLEGSTSFSGTADISVDNICIFVANRGANLPTPTDPNAIIPVDLGFNYTSCDDVDGLLAGFGVNIQQYRAEYEAGPSLWDPIGWVPWLVAAFWNAMALYLCVFMAAFVTLVDILEYLINNFLNIASWLIRSWPVFVQWLLSVWAWLLATLPNVLAWLGDTIVLGLTWFFLSGGNLFVFTFFMLGYFIQAALDFLNWLGFDLPDNLLDLLLNGLIGIANLFITAWNLFLPALEFVISGIVNFWVGLWNMLAPFLSAVWSYISGGSLPLLLLNPLVYLVLAVFNLVWMLILWVWANVFMVVNIPIQFYYAFDTGVRGEAFASLIACASENFWCQMLAGVQLVNQTSAHSIGYPIVIVGIIVGSLVIFWEYIWALFHTEIS